MTPVDIDRLVDVRRGDEVVKIAAQAANAFTQQWIDRLIGATPPFDRCHVDMVARRAAELENGLH